MNSNIILLLLVFLFFSVIVFLFFFFAVKALFDAEKSLVTEGKKDEDVLKEGSKLKNKKSGKISLIISSVIGGIVLAGCVLLVILKNVTNPLNVFSAVPVAITSGSMQEVDSGNSYLKVENYEANDLKNQFAAGSIIILHKMPAKDELKLYDVVAYKDKEGTTIVHRIIGFGYYGEDNTFVITNDIKDATDFIFRGDNNNTNDAYYVKYSDMIGIYKGETVQVLGYVVEFVQSYFGLITFAAVFGMLEAYEIFDKKDKKVILDRYEVICGNYDTDDDAEIKAINYKKEEDDE